MFENRRYQRFFAELKRRKVFRVAAVYGAVAFVVLQAADILVPALALPEALMRGIALISVLLFPVALVLAWAFEVTPDGVRRTDDAEEGEITQMISEPASRRWPSGMLALVGIIALAIAAWLTLRPGAQEGVAVDARSESTPAAAADDDGRARDVRLAMTAVDEDLRPSIAVMPFADLSAAGDQEYFGDGMTEEILNALARIKGLRLAARTSTFAYKDSNPTIDQIREELGVDAILEGSVRREGDQLRITAQLIETETGFHLWSKTYDRSVESVFAIQSEIAESIAEEMKVSLGLEAGQDLVVATGDLTAYDLYLQGRARMRARGPGVAEAIELFEAAVARDSSYAPAWASLAESYTLLPHHLARAPDSATVSDAFASAESAARRALILDPANASARVALGNIRRDSWRWEEAADQYERALALEPDNVEAQHQYAEYLFGTGRIAEGLATAEHAMALDPLSGIRLAIVAAGRWLNDDCEGAIEAGEQALERTPSLMPMQIVIVGCLLHLGDPEAATAAAIGYWAESRQDTLNERALLEALQNRDPARIPEGEWSEGLFAEVWMAVGDTAAALAQLERSPVDLPFFVPYQLWSPGLDSLRDHPRFQAVLRRVDLEGRTPIRTER
jgi:TolB-like protein/tetratricopeptide (TPR) repeat protein